MTIYKVDFDKLSAADAIVATLQILEGTEDFMLASLGGALVFAINFEYPFDRDLTIAMRDNFVFEPVHKAITISGLSADPRNLWEVPEVIELSNRLAHAFPDLILDKLLHDETRRWLALCEAVHCGAEAKLGGTPEYQRWARANQHLRPPAHTWIKWNDTSYSRTRENLRVALEICKLIDNRKGKNPCAN